MEKISIDNKFVNPYIQTRYIGDYIYLKNGKHEFVAKITSKRSYKILKDINQTFTYDVYHTPYVNIRFVTQDEIYLLNDYEFKSLMI